MNVRRRPLKLEPCERQGRGSGAELFVVEGDSASLAVTQVRDARCQAVLPMQGKPMNALRASAGKVAGNSWYKALVEAIGTGWGAAFDAAALQYDRIVLLMDPDADGIHCGALLLMFFHRWMPQLLEGGYLEMVRAPVGEVRCDGDGRPRYAYADAQFQSLCMQLRSSGGRPFTALRYRGLASLDPAVLRELCVDPASRNGRRLTEADAQLAMAVFASMRELPPQRPLF